MTIGLLHHTGGGNLGDEGTQAAVIQNIRRRWPDASLVGLTMNPDDTVTRHGIPAYAIRRTTWTMGFPAGGPQPTRRDRARTALGRFAFLFEIASAVYGVAVRWPKRIAQETSFLLESFRIVRSLDLLIVNGGGQLTEWDGPWAFTYTVFKWVQLARLAGVRCLFVNIGAGPLTRPLSRWFSRRALSMAAYASFRDETSRTLARAIGFRGDSQVFPDTVYSLDVPVTSPARLQDAGEPVVGVAPMPYCDPRTFAEKDQAVYERYIETLAEFTTWLTHHGYRVVLFGSDAGVDPIAIDDLHDAVRRRGPRAASIVRAAVQSTDELLAEMSAMDYVVTCRFHGVVFAHLLGKPVIALSHHPKVTTLMSDIGLSKYCLHIDRCDAEALRTALSALRCERDEVTRRMTATRVAFRQQLATQFDCLFPQEAA